jgi:hypothetical protein
MPARTVPSASPLERLSKLVGRSELRINMIYPEINKSGY